MWNRVAVTLLALWPLSALPNDGEGELPAVVYPKLPQLGADAQAFVTPPWRLEFEERGDLNADGHDDLLLVLRMADPANVLHNDGFGPVEFDTNPRMLAVAFAETDDQGYRLALQDHALIPRPHSPVMQDYLAEMGSVSTRRGAFKVTLHSFASAGTWEMGYTALTFRYQDGCFRLIGHDRSSTRRNTGEMLDISVNYLTGKARIANGSIESDDEDVVWRRVSARTLHCLADIGDGFDFDPGVPEAPAAN